MLRYSVEHHRRFRPCDAGVTVKVLRYDFLELPHVADSNMCNEVEVSRYQKHRSDLPNLADVLHEGIHLPRVEFGALDEQQRLHRQTQELQVDFGMRDQQTNTIRLKIAEANIRLNLWSAVVFYSA